MFVCNSFNISAADLVAIGDDVIVSESIAAPGIALTIMEEAVVARRGIVNVGFVVIVVWPVVVVAGVEVVVVVAGVVVVVVVVVVAAVVGAEVVVVVEVVVVIGTVVVAAVVVVVVATVVGAGVVVVIGVAFVVVDVDELMDAVGRLSEFVETIPFIIGVKTSTKGLIGRGVIGTLLSIGSSW